MAKLVELLDGRLQLLLGQSLLLPLLLELHGYNLFVAVKCSLGRGFLRVKHPQLLVLLLHLDLALVVHRERFEHGLALCLFLLVLFLKSRDFGFLLVYDFHDELPVLVLLFKSALQDGLGLLRLSLTLLQSEVEGLLESGIVSGHCLLDGKVLIFEMLYLCV